VARPIDWHQFWEISGKKLCPEFYSLHREYVLDTFFGSVMDALRLGETPLDFLRLS
jgi:hypothetical protein